MQIRACVLFLCLLAGACATAPRGTVPAAPVRASAMPLGAETAPPSGYVAFCARQPQDCRTNGRAAVPRLTQTLWAELIEVNDRINAAIRPGEDYRLFGQLDYWTYPDGAGDCEDYALAKRRELLARGLPAESLLLAVVQSPSTGRHAVLIAVTDRGDFVLDSVVPQVMAWHAAPYRWISRQSAHDTMVWRSAAAEPHGWPARPATGGIPQPRL